MKRIFPEPIGTLRDLGTPRQWAKEIACALLCAAILLLIYITI